MHTYHTYSIINFNTQIEGCSVAAGSHPFAYAYLYILQPQP